MEIKPCHHGPVIVKIRKTTGTLTAGGFAFNYFIIVNVNLGLKVFQTCQLYWKTVSGIPRAAWCGPRSLATPGGPAWSATIPPKELHTGSERHHPFVGFGNNSMLN